MNKKALLALLLVMTMLMSSCALVVKHDDVDQKRAIITLDGEVIATKAEVNAAVNSNLEYMASYYSNYYGYTIDTTDSDVIASVRTSTIESLQEQAVKDKKVEELGLALTDEEIAECEEEIASYQEMLLAWGITTPTDVTTADELVYYYFGVNSDSLKEDKLEEKLKSAVTADVTVTEEDLQSTLDSKVEDDKSTFETTLSTYGTRVNNGTTVYYRPAGYRMVRNLLIKYEEADSDLITAIQAKVTEQTTAMNTAATALGDDLDAMVADVTATANAGEVTDGVTAYTASVTDLFEATEDADTQTKQDNARAYVEAKTLLDAYQADLDAATAAAQANIQPKVDAVMARLNAGEDFVTVMNETTEDTGMASNPDGYAVCEGFSSFDSAFVNAAMAIPAVGEWSEPTAGSYGYYIIQYASEVTEGAVTLDEVRDTIADEALSTKVDDTYDSLVDSWVDAGKWVINTAALDD